MQTIVLVAVVAHFVEKKEQSVVGLLNALYGTELKGWYTLNYINMAKSASTTSKGSSKKAPKKKTSPENMEPALQELFLDGIKDIYWAEKKLVSTLPKLQEAATSEELGQALGTHVEQTNEHISRLEQVFELLEEKAQAKKCDAMDGLTKEAESILDDTDDGTATRDVGIILACQKVEHYEIATYGGLKQLATTLGRDDIADILGQTLEEEKETDQILTDIAENDVNYEASQEKEEA